MKKKVCPSQPQEKGQKKKRKSKEIQEKIAERWEENRVRAYFVRLFEKYDVHNEKQFISFGKWLIFLVLVLVEVLILVHHLSNYESRGGIKTLTALLIVEGALTLAEGLKLFIVKKSKLRSLFFAVDALAACGFMFFADGTLPIVIYMLILTQFYISADHTRLSVVLLCVSGFLYVAMYALRAVFLSQTALPLAQILMQPMSAIFALIVHFITVNVALAFYRQFLRLDKALAELDESKRELEKAYQVVAEVTVLEERQRIAKEIHDTAGHSLTTVIMQTESAKRIVEQNPQEAKNKIVAANLQAKHALEELRSSVHLLSGSAENNTLKTALERVINESMDGTGITIRSQIEDVELNEEKRRFVCNTLKEGISNGLRHGGATAFWVELKQEDGKIFFLLSDNGKGVDITTLKKGFGLTAMQDRAKMLGGEVTFDSELGEGFEIRLTI